MPTSYYLVCPESNRFVWIGTLGETASANGVDLDLVSNFFLMHRGKMLTVVNEMHQIIEEGLEWERWAE